MPLMKLQTLVAGLALAGLATHALAQTAEPQRITITGSSIKRIAAEGALPIQVITGGDLQRQGITSAEQLIQELSANGNGLDNLAANADVVGGAQRGNNGATSANLRGQGSNATLILLNGRRVAAHGLNGGVVDLNQIPMAAIERVEILKDGASATYGTDAIGGVINFILRTNFTGALVRATADITQKAGGEIASGALVGGFGNLESDGYNVLATLGVRENKALRGDQRDFVNTFQPNRGLSVDTRGTPFATLFPLAGTLFPTAASFPNVPGTTTPAGGGLNVLDLPGQPGCGSIDGQAPYAELLWNVANAALACAWDTGRAAVLQQPVTSSNFVLRGTLMAGAHTLAAEVTASKTESAKRFSHLQITPNTTTQQLRYPRNSFSQASYDRVFDVLRSSFPTSITEAQRGQAMAYRWRCIECGPREIDTEADTQRLALTAEGPLFAGWDYRAGVLQAKSEAKSTLGGGYYYRGTTATGASDGGPGIIPALNSGRINIFLYPGQTQSADGLAALEAASARGVVLYGGEFTMTQADMSASGPVFKLPGGDAMAAVGVDLRSEKYKFNGDERDLAAQQRIIVAAPFDQTNVLAGAKRDVTAVYGELLLPIVKGLEATLAVRQDKYDGFGTTTNPKISALWKPNASFLMRGSYSTGFRVPTFNQLYNGSAESLYTGTALVDPLTCPSGRPSATIPGCAFIDRAANIINGGKPDLGPEEATMSSLGFIWEPSDNFSIGMDWWGIQREGTIQTLSLTQLIDNYALFPERFGRNAAGNIISVDQRWVNAGETQTEGVEVNLRGGFNAMGARFSAGLDGTYLLKKRSRVLPSVPFGPSEIGQFSFAGDLGLRWKHSAFVTYARGDWTGTLSQTFRSGYNDQVLPGVAAGRVSPPDWKPKVDAYTTYNLGVTYTGIKNLTLTGLVRNVLDTDPPFAVTYDSNFGSGSSWEPRVADPRGRAFVFTVQYRFF
jgi:iron complex outermembrane recepter protein